MSRISGRDPSRKEDVLASLGSWSAARDTCITDNELGRWEEVSLGTRMSVWRPVSNYRRGNRVVGGHLMGKWEDVRWPRRFHV